MTPRPAGTCFVMLAFVLGSSHSLLALGPIAPSWDSPQFIGTIEWGTSSPPVISNRALAFDHYGDPGLAYMPDWAPWQPSSGSIVYSKRLPGLGWASATVIGALCRRRRARC